ncbi:hypothetical protein N39L_03860 [Limnospira platensis NIES-39]|uniref:Transposase n=1 Tax=Limnospira platensis NIES-46 TaxID=1236695 RepID=A0A5M3T9T4_LIMPL|nr:hypothetical protein N39L_03860 [Arthrospira platensis NIES-39]GCE95627.1 hypothetical protein NIES46_36930 [Arthrospira platensis NIES-46]
MFGKLLGAPNLWTIGLSDSSTINRNILYIIEVIRADIGKHIDNSGNISERL